jgi:hypothetical protein
MCRCTREVDHDGPHQCSCTASWIRDAQGVVKAVRKATALSTVRETGQEWRRVDDACNRDLDPSAREP